MRYRSPATLNSTLAGKHVLFMGDSITRYLAEALLRATGRSAAVPRWHMDMTYPLAASNATLDFWWSPYPSNITDSMQRVLNTTARPDLVVASFCAWHLHSVMNISDWSRQLDEVDAGVKILAADGLRPIVVSCPHSVQDRLTTDEWAVIKPLGLRYNEVLMSRTLRSWRLLDLNTMSTNCGDPCSKDREHAFRPVYDAAVQVLLGMSAGPLLGEGER
ncbi:hypothetical protein F751_0911 [Auxenochlorella protothecoides]|uniref:SGNH domain-containing protein n=1 Tax=Auxenochlorella protothecoides TaxID=3075 RepID=A0A087SI19_AUXPR|nr:hypothetical protein F751_0911 [Auxenochlorella protothecoides]KFM25373.1 hypothetical protein F751_0911 [Auxenochlorella protothecoides]